MKAKRVTSEQMQAALAAVNKKYAGNVEFKTFCQEGRHINFTLRVKSSFGPGHRIGFSGKRLPCACWHVHGDFFDTLLGIEPSAEIVSAMSKVTCNGGNWQDRNIGSQFQPLYYSEACECNR